MELNNGSWPRYCGHLFHCHRIWSLVPDPVSECLKYSCRKISQTLTIVTINVRQLICVTFGGYLPCKNIKMSDKFQAILELQIRNLDVCHIMASGLYLLSSVQICVRSSITKRLFRQCPLIILASCVGYQMYPFEKNGSILVSYAGCLFAPNMYFNSIAVLK